MVVSILLVLGGPISAASAQATPSTLRCRADATLLSVAGTVHTRALPYFVEVELTLLNKSQAGIRIDPWRFVLVPDQGDPVPPVSPDQVVYALGGPGPLNVGYFGVFWGGWGNSIGVAVGGAVPLNLSARAIEARILRPGELAAGASLKGSVYFRPASWPSQFTLLLDGLAVSPGAGLPPVELRNCQMPFRPSEPPVVLTPPPPGARTIALSARADAGPIVVSVSGVEFTRQATTLTMVVENSAEVDADLFVAIGEARLTDDAGKTYAVRMLRSSLSDRVAPRDQSRGTLVFEPLPIPSTPTSAVLTMTGVRVAGAQYDIRLDLRF
jgi:hypothetical protein